MNAQCGLDLFFTVLLAYSRLRDGGEQPQSEREKEPRPDGTEERAGSLAFFARLPNLRHSSHDLRSRLRA